MTTASSLNCEAFKSYNVLHCYTVKYYKSCKPGHRINLVTAIKVFKMKHMSDARQKDVNRHTDNYWDYEMGRTKSMNLYLGNYNICISVYCN